MPSSAAARASATRLGERPAGLDARRGASTRPGRARRRSSCRRARPRRARRCRAARRRAPRRGRPASNVSASPSALPGPPQGRAPQRPAGAADRRDERRAGLHQRLARRRAAVEAVQLGLDSGEPPGHVGAVVGVADGRVELGEVVALLGDRRSAGAHPTGHGLGVHVALPRSMGYAPQRSAAVFTGASHRPVSSSSSSSSVIEQPAISRLVM